MKLNEQISFQQIKFMDKILVITKISNIIVGVNSGLINEIDIFLKLRLVCINQIQIKSYKCYISHAKCCELKL